MAVTITRRGRRAALMTVAALLCVPVAMAQTGGANLVGKVQDKSGKPLPGATITATQKDTGLTRSTVTESDGTFRLPSVPVGTYNVVAELNGFATAVKNCLEAMLKCMESTPTHDHPDVLGELEALEVQVAELRRRLNR